MNEVDGVPFCVAWWTAARPLSRVEKNAKGYPQRQGKPACLAATELGQRHAAAELGLVARAVGVLAHDDEMRVPQIGNDLKRRPVVLRRGGGSEAETGPAVSQASSTGEESIASILHHSRWVYLPSPKFYHRP